MAYLTIAATAYRVRIEGSSGRRIVFEKRFRAMDVSLVRSVQGSKKEITVEVLGLSSGSVFSIAAAETFIGVLVAGNVSVAGDIGTFTAAPRDIGFRDLVAGGSTRRFVTVTLEQV